MVQYDAKQTFFFDIVSGRKWTTLLVVTCLWFPLLTSYDAEAGTFCLKIMSQKTVYVFGKPTQHPLQQHHTTSQQPHVVVVESLNQLPPPTTQHSIVIHETSTSCDSTAKYCHPKTTTKSSASCLSSSCTSMCNRCISKKIVKRYKITLLWTVLITFKCF